MKNIKLLSKISFKVPLKKVKIICNIYIICILYCNSIDPKGLIHLTYKFSEDCMKYEKMVGKQNTNTLSSTVKRNNVNGQPSQ